jgi:hypothetical protein
MKVQSQAITKDLITQHNLAEEKQVPSEKI